MVSNWWNWVKQMISLVLNSYSTSSILTWLWSEQNQNNCNVSGRLSFKTSQLWSPTSCNSKNSPVFRCWTNPRFPVDCQRHHCLTIVGVNTLHVEHCWLKVITSPACPSNHIGSNIKNISRRINCCCIIIANCCW